MALTPENEQAFITRNQEYSAPQNDFLASVSKMPQDQASKILRLATQANIDPMVASKNPNAAVQSLIGASDFEDVGNFSPKTYSFLSDPLHMAIARDKRNVNTLVDLENEWKVSTAFKNGMKSLVRDPLAMVQGAFDTLAEGSKNRDNMPPEYKMWSEQGGTQLLQDAAKNTSNIVNSDLLKNKDVKADSTIGQYGLDIVETAPQIASQVAISLLSGGTASMLFMGSQIAGSEYEKLRAEGVGAERAFGAGIMDAAAQAPLERIGLNRIMKKIPAGSSRAFKARDIAESTLTESLTEWIQQYPESAAEIWAKHPEMTADQRGEQFMKDFVATTKEGAYQGLVAAPFGFLGGAVKVKLEKKAAEAYVEQRENNRDIIAKSALVGISPEVIEKHLSALSEDEKTYVDPEALVTLYQSNIISNEEIDALFGTNQEQILKDLTTGNMTEVSQAKYDVAITQHPQIHEMLKEDISSDIDGLTLRRLNDRNTADVAQVETDAKQRQKETRTESDTIRQSMVDAGVKKEVADLATVGLAGHARIYGGDNPAQWLRDHAPVFRKAKETPKLGIVQQVKKFFQSAAWHGTPHAFDKFSLNHIDSGEGAQAFGWGLYFASDKKIAEYYRDRLSNNLMDASPIFKDKNGKIIRYENDEPLEMALLTLNFNENNYKGAFRDINESLDVADDEEKDIIQKAIIELKKAESDGVQAKRTTGSLYEVSLSPDHHEFLDWNKLLSEQSDEVRKLLKDAPQPQLLDDTKHTGKDFYDSLTKLTGSAEEASKHLNSIGIPGIKYLDGISQNNDKGNFNYVVFDNKKIKIVNAYYQNAEDPRGMIQWNAEGRAIITYFESADPSTVIHEMVGHYFVQNLIDQGAEENAPAWMQKDRKAALNFAGIESWETATDEQKRDAHEKLASAAEAYIMEGNAPSLETRSLFKRFADWMTDIYRHIKPLDINLTPEVRSVFDRLLATQEEIDNLAAIDDYLQRIPKAVYDTLTDGQKRELESRLESATERAESQVRAHLMIEFTAENSFKITEEGKIAFKRISEEVKSQPLYVAEATIQDTFKRKAKRIARDYIGNTPFSPDGVKPVMTPLDQLEAVRDSLIKRGKLEDADMMQKQIDQLKQDNPIQVQELSVDQQMEFEFIAETFSYSSGSELAQNLIAYNNSDKTIQNRFDEHMTEFKKTLTDDVAMSNNVEEAMYSAEGALLIATELQTITEKQLGKVISREEARLAAQMQREKARQSASNSIAKLTISDAMRLQTWISATVRAAEKARLAMAKGDLATAATQKEIQLFNHAMVQESLNTRREYERLNRYLQRQKSSKQEAWLADEETADGSKVKTDKNFIQFADLMRRFGFERKDFQADMREESLAQYVARQEIDNPEMISIADWLAVNDQSKPPLKLTIGEYQDVTNAIKNIKKIASAGKNANAFISLNGEGLGATVYKLMTTGEANVTDKQIDMPDKVDPTIMASMIAGLRKPSKWLLQMDGFKNFGPWAKALYYSLSDCQAYKSKLVNNVYTALDQAFTDAGVTKEQRYQDAHKKVYIAEWKTSVTKNYLRSVLLNMGSSGNLQRLFNKHNKPVGQKESTAWTEEAVSKVLTKYLTANDIRLTQKIWDSINLYKEYNTMVKKVTGVELKQVNPQPISFTMPDGEVIHLEGGYYHLKADPRASKIAELREAEKLGDSPGIMPYPQTGSSKQRAQTASYAVDLDMSNLYSSVMEHAHDIAFRPTMIDLNKLMRDDPIKEILRRKLGDAAYQAMSKWLKIVGTGKNERSNGNGWLDGLLSVALKHTVITNLLFRPGTIFQNAANPTLYGNSVDGFTNKDAAAAYLKYGIGEYIPMAVTGREGAQEIRDFVYEKSAIMHDKMENPDYSLRELHKMEVNPLTKSSNEVIQNIGIKVALSHDQLVKVGSGMLAFADQLTDIPMWRGAYFQGIEQGKSESDAIRFADAIIEASTGTGRTIDSSMMQLGSPTEKLLTMFTSFINTQYNRWANEHQIFLKEKDSLRLISFVGTQYLLFGAISALASFKPPKEDQSIWEWFMKEVVEWPLSMVPVGGGLAKLVVDHAMGFKTFSWAMSPVERNTEQVINTLMKLNDVAAGNKPIDTLAEPGAQSVAFLAGYPDQINDWFFNAYDILSGKMEASPIDLIRRRPKRERN